MFPFCVFLCFCLFHTENDIFPQDFASRGGPRSPTQTPQKIRGNTNTKINIYLRAGEIFKLLKNKLLSLSVYEKVEDDSFDYLTTWVIVSKILCTLYSQLLVSYCSSLSESESLPVSTVRYESNRGNDNDNNNNNDDDNDNDNDSNDNYNTNNNHNTGRGGSSSSSSSSSNNNSNSNNKTEEKTHNVRTASKEYVLSILTEYYSLLETVLDVLTVRVRYTNPKFLSEYLSSISAVIHSTSKTECLPCVLSIVQSTCVAGKGVRKLKRKICTLLLDIARQIRDSGERIALCCAMIVCAVVHCGVLYYTVLCCIPYHS
jgi:hypothetical protein